MGFSDNYFAELINTAAAQAEVVTSVWHISRGLAGLGIELSPVDAADSALGALQLPAVLPSILEGLQGFLRVAARPDQCHALATNDVFVLLSKFLNMPNSKSVLPRDELLMREADSKGIRLNAYAALALAAIALDPGCRQAFVDNKTLVDVSLGALVKRFVEAPIDFYADSTVMSALLRITESTDGCAAFVAARGIERLANFLPPQIFLNLLESESGLKAIKANLSSASGSSGVLALASLVYSEDSSVRERARAVRVLQGLLTKGDWRDFVPLLLDFSTTERGCALMLELGCVPFFLNILAGAEAQIVVVHFEDDYAYHTRVSGIDMALQLIAQMIQFDIGCASLIQADVHRVLQQLQSDVYPFEKRSAVLARLLDYQAASAATATAVTTVMSVSRQLSSGASAAPAPK